MGVFESAEYEVVSTNNSSTTNLTSGSTFTGISDVILGYDAVEISFKADQAATIQFQQSTDNSNWDFVDSFTVAASTGVTRSFKANAQYARILVTNNGDSTTTFLRLQTILTPIGNTLPTALTQLGNLKTEDAANGPVTPGAVANKSLLTGGQFNTSLPTLTNTQQTAIQLDSSGRLIMAPVAEDHNYGTVGANTLRTAAQIGNTAGAADFNAGTTGAQTLRVIANQGANNATPWNENIAQIAGTATVTAGTAGLLAVGGNVASASTDSGYPVKTGAIYNSTLQTFTTGQRADAQSDVNGRHIVNVGSGGQLILGGISSLGGTASLNCQGMSTMGVDLTGTWVATILIEGQFGDGVFTPISSMNAVTGVFATTYTVPTFIIIPCSGYAQIRLRSTTYTSGTANISLNTSMSNNIVSINPLNNNVTTADDGPVAPGAAATKSSLIGGQFNTSLPTLTNTQQSAAQLDVNGRIIVNSTPVDGTKTTYGANIVALVAAATPTDVFTITGSASKTIRVTSINFSGTQTTASNANVILLKRSTANSAGTSTTSTVVPYDSTNAAGTAVIRAYTANPTLGTLVGNLKSDKVFIATTLVDSNNINWTFGNRPSQAIVLRGTSEVLALNLNSTTIAGNNLNISIEWTEES